MTNAPRKVRPSLPAIWYYDADHYRRELETIWYRDWICVGHLSALERAGNPAKMVLIKAGEGHGFGTVENNVELYDQILKFLDAQIGQPR